MPSLPPSVVGPAPGPPTPPLAGPEQAALWIYVDQQRTHEVQVGLARDPDLRLFVRERALAVDDPTCVLETRHPIGATWESRLHHLQLEERLTLLGTYYRASVAARTVWTPVRRPCSIRTLEVDPLVFDGLRRDVQVHFYGSRHDGMSALLLAIPQADAQPRHALARLEFAFPDAERGKLTLVHGRLPPPLLRSALAMQHIDLVRRGLERPGVIDRTVAAAWCADAERAIDGALARVREGRFGGHTPLPEPTVAPPAAGGGEAAPRASGSVIPGKVVGAARRHPNGARVITRLGEASSVGSSGKDEEPPAYEIEYETPEPPTRGPMGDVRKIEENTLDFQSALTNPRILALHTRYLAPGEEAALYAQGEIALRAAMRAKRLAAPVAEQHLLSILEASMLVRYALSSTSERKVDPQAARLLRRALVYLP